MWSIPLTLLLVSSAAAQNASNTIAGVSVKIQGQSGKMTLSNDGDTSGKSVTVMMDNLYELDASGSQIGNTGPNAGKHSRNTFASVDFTIDAKPTRTKVSGKDADRIDFKTTLLGSSQLTVSTYVFLQAGEIKPTANETWTIGAGSAKFNIAISSWPFCAGENTQPCSKKTGEFLELGIQIKGSSATATAAAGSDKKFTLGSGLTVDLSNKVQIDGTWVAMPAGYPKVETQGSKQLFIFRFPKFSTSLAYDPIIDGLGSSSGSGGSTSNPCFPSHATALSADGRSKRLDELVVGDRIHALTAEGVPTVDTVSFFSTARAEVESDFIQMALSKDETSKSATFMVTPEHHLPVGETCCATVKKAKDLQVGDTVFRARAPSADRSDAEKLTIAATKIVSSKGLHSPVLINGGYPVIDGIVTSYDAPNTVYWASHALPYAEPLCQMTGTCAQLARAVIAAGFLKASPDHLLGQQ